MWHGGSVCCAQWAAASPSHGGNAVRYEGGCDGTGGLRCVSVWCVWGEGRGGACMTIAWGGLSGGAGRGRGKYMCQLRSRTLMIVL